MKMTPDAPPVAPAAPAPQVRSPRAHEADPVLAQALFALWSGDPAVSIDSPPGAGKTRLITHLAAQLSERAGMRVAIAAQTRAQAYDVANRAAAAGAEVTFLHKHKAPRPAELDAAVRLASAKTLHRATAVVVATTARWQWTPLHSFHADVLLVDEAYQMTFANLGGLGALADQVALVGDPGQIDPVVVARTDRWEHRSDGPHVPAPTALLAAHGEAVTTLQLPCTWRLGPQTTDLIRPLYSIPFESARSERTAVRTGQDLPEVAQHPVHVTAGPADATLLLAAADAVREHITSTQVRDDMGNMLPVEPGDVAVIAPHVEQATLIAAALSDLPDVFVGTINQAQGLEREVVVAVHPLAGYPDAPTFATDLGRLCVALSRHRTHLTLVTDQRTPDVLGDAAAQDPDNEAAQMNLRILESLTAATK